MGFYGLAASLVLVWSVAVGAVAYSKGSASRNPEISELQAAIKASEVLAAEASDRAAKASARVVTVYKDRVKVIREVQPAEIQLVEVVKSESTCLAPPAFRVLHDSAATGSDPAKASPGVDAAPVPLEDAAATVAENYRIARENAERLAALHELIRSQ